jgi:hypothetical protein
MLGDWGNLFHPLTLLAYPLRLSISIQFIACKSSHQRWLRSFFSTLAFATSRHHKDLEQESQRRTREVDALEQQLSKAAADTWPKVGNIKCAERMLKSHDISVKNRIRALLLNKCHSVCLGGMYLSRI